jgi:YD repeat-containing protein
VLSVDGPRTDVNDVTSYTYDAAGNLETATTALGHVTTYSNYDGAGRVGRIAAPGGKVTTLQYTARGKLNKVEHSVDGITESMSIDYDPVGNVTKVILQDGSTVEYSYDDAHRLTSIVDGLGNRIDYTLDLNGNRTAEKVTDRTGVLVRNISRVFNKMNWVTQVTGGVQ